MGTSRPPRGWLGQWDWCPGILSPLGCGNWAPKVLAVLRESALELTPPSICLGFPTPTEERRWELEELGLYSSRRPHPRLPLDVAMGLCGCSRAAVTSGCGSSPCSGLGHVTASPPPLPPPLPCPSSCCALRPHSLLAPGHVAPCRGVCPRGYALRGGQGGRQESCHPRASRSLWAGSA